MALKPITVWETITDVNAAPSAIYINVRYIPDGQCVPATLPAMSSTIPTACTIPTTFPAAVACSRGTESITARRNNPAKN